MLRVTSASNPNTNVESDVRDLVFAGRWNPLYYHGMRNPISEPTQAYCASRTPLFLALAALLTFATSLVHSQSLAEYQKSFETKKSTIEADYTKSAKKLLVVYLSRLTSLESKAKSDGNLELVLRVKEEAERVNLLQEEALERVDVQGKDALTTLQNAVVKAVSQYQKKRDDAQQNLLAEQKNRLEALKKTLTQNDKIDEAVKVQRAIADMEARQQPSPPSGPNRFAENPYAPPASSRFGPPSSQFGPPSSRTPPPPPPAADVAPASPSEVPMWSSKRRPPNASSLRSYTSMVGVPKFGRNQPMKLYPPQGGSLQMYGLDVRFWEMSHTATVPVTRTTTSSSGHMTTETTHKTYIYTWPRLMVKAKGRLQNQDLILNTYRYRSSSSSAPSKITENLSSFPGRLLLDSRAGTHAFHYVHVHITDSLGRTLFEGATIPNVSPIRQRVGAGGLVSGARPSTSAIPGTTRGQGTSSSYRGFRGSSSRTVGRKPGSTTRSSFGNRSQSSFRK